MTPVGHRKRSHMPLQLEQKTLIARLRSDQGQMAGDDRPALNKAERYDRSNGLDDSFHKALSTLTAEFALAGHAVHSLADGSFLVCKWGQSRFCKDITELREFAVRLGVRNG